MAQKLSQKQRLDALEKEIKSRGVKLAYERLMFAGLMLKGGLCWFRGQYYIFVDRRQKPAQRIESLSAALEEMDRLSREGKLENPVSSGEADETIA